MKKLLLLLALFGVLCSSCSKEGDEVSNPQEPPKTEEDVLIIDGDRNYVVDALGGELVVKVKTNKWYGVFIPEEASWITLADTRSLREDELTFIISPNEEFAVRCATLTLSVDWDTFQEITIVQNPASIDIPNNQIWYTSTNGEIILPYIGRGNSHADALTSFGANIISNTYENGKGVITFDSDVTKIGECAFCGYYSSPLLPGSSEEDEGYTLCRNLATILIPNSVTTIGDDAFWNCDSLISVTMPNSVLTIGSGSFRDCYDLISVTIPDSVTSIGSFAFDDCYDLTSVTIPDSVTTIEWGAFSWCESLTSVTIPNSVTTIETQAFQYCSLTSVTIPDSVTTIEGGAFYCCSSLQEFNGKFASEDGRCLIVDGTLNDFAPAGLTEYTIPDSVTTIGALTFRDCSSLTSVTIPDSVAEIGEMAFFGCYSLTSVTIPDSVTEIKYYAFAYCYDLTSVTIPDSVTTIGEGAFYGCSSLTSVTIPDSVTTVGGYAFSGCGNLNAVYITDLVAWCNIDFINPLTDGSVDLSANPLCYAKNLYLNGELVTDLVIPDGVNEIKLMAFALCDSITNVTIPDSVTTIGDCAFYNCSRLTSVTIGDSVTEIGWFAFTYCNNLNTVYCKAINPPTTIVHNNGYWSGFAKVDESGNIYIDCTIYVPTESVKAYKNASGWSEYADDIVGYNF